VLLVVCGGLKKSLSASPHHKLRACCELLLTRMYVARQLVLTAVRFVR
jgi:hypothetical protein